MLPIVLSAIATVCGCVPPIIKGKNMKLILLVVFLNNLLVAISYILTKDASGAAICFVGAATSIVNYFFDSKGKRLPVWLLIIYALAFVAVNLTTFKQAADILTLLAALAFVMAVSQKSGKRYRLWALANAGLWLIFDLIVWAEGPIIAHLAQFAIIIIGMVAYDRKKTESTEK